MSKRLAIVVPCYNEAEVLDDTVVKLCGVISDLIIKKKIDNDSFILFVDDGSKDKTWEKIEAANKSFKYVKGLKLAGNVGHQNALLAGLMYAKDISDATISIDADLQDDIDAIEVLLAVLRARDLNLRHRLAIHRRSAERTRDVLQLRRDNCLIFIVPDIDRVIIAPAIAAI